MEAVDTVGGAMYATGGFLCRLWTVFDGEVDESNWTIDTLDAPWVIPAGSTHEIEGVPVLTVFLRGLI